MSTIRKIEKEQNKTTIGALQRTLIERRLREIQIASELIERELSVRPD